MKKTFISVLALCTASLAMADSFTATTIGGTGGPGYPNASNASYGYVADFSQALTFSLSADNIAAFDTVTLDSITMNITGSTSSAKVAVFEVAGIGADGRDTFVDFCGLSDLTSVSTATTFTFSSLEIDTTKTYAFYFVNDSISTETLESAASFSDIQSNALRFRAQHTWTSVSGVVEHRLSDNWASEAPVVGYNFTGTTATGGDAVPEPATATLSLLALAGLAARRRRK